MGLLANNWSDEARAASLEVRRAKRQGVSVGSGYWYAWGKWAR